jgi:hypothetical protein
MSGKTASNSRLELTGPMRSSSYSAVSMSSASGRIAGFSKKWSRNSLVRGQVAEKPTLRPGAIFGVADNPEVIFSG